MSLRVLGLALARLTAIFAAGLVTIVAPARADQALSTVIVVDGSGSMWGKMAGDKEAKFYATRDALRDLLGKTPPQSRVGLASFGHRRKGDCSDAEIITPIEAGGAEGVAAALEALSPKGKGPMTLALRETVKAMGPGAPGHIILVHDNLDNCQQDVCAAAQDFAKTNPAIKIHVVSLGLTKAERQRMQCLSATTGGEHFNAADQNAIAEALAEAFRLAGLDSETARPAEATPATSDAGSAAKPQGPPGLRLTAAMVPGGPMIDMPLAWHITKSDAAADVAPLVERKSREINEALPPGRYSVTVEHGLVTRRFDIEVADTGPTVKRLALDAGVVKIAASASRQGDRLAAPVMTIRSVADNNAIDAAPLWIGREAQAELVVPAGKFAVDVTDGMAKSGAMLDVAPGSTIRSDLVLETGRLELTATGFAGGPPLDRVLYLISVDDADAPQGRREIARSTAPDADFTLQAGTYYVTARHGSSEVRERVAISSGDIVKRTMTLDIARLNVKPTLAGAAPPQALPIVTRIFEAEGAKRLVGQSTSNIPTFVLGAGRYRIDAQLGTLNIRSTRSITLTAGKNQTVDLTLEAGAIHITGLGPEQPSVAVQAAIRDTKGRVVWRGRQGDNLKTIMAPGAYVLQIDSSKGRSERPISLEAGETRVIDMTTP